jgi:hypothetical protein
MFFGVALIMALFAHDNKEFFDTVEQNRKDGMSWEYVGKQEPGNNPAITIKDFQNNEVIYFKMTK